MQRAKLFLIGLVFLTLSLSGCGIIGQQDKPEINLKDVFPEDLAVDKVKRLDVDDDGEKEWLAFYFIDLVEGDVEGSPIAGAVYRPLIDPDRRTPPRLIPELLWLPGQGYLCLYHCDAKMEEVIKDAPGKELVIRDKPDERKSDLAGVAIFGWKVDPQTRQGSLVPLGHFRGDLIELERDKVTVIHKYNDRSNLATEEIYEPADGRYYKAEVRDVDDPRGELNPPQIAQVVPLPEPPKDPAAVKQPEKLVLAFYDNIRDSDKIKEFFTDDAWENIGQECADGKCGCSSKRGDVSHVTVKQIAYEGEVDQETQVVVQVVCVSKNGEPDKPTAVTWWTEKQPDETWQVTNVTLGGNEYLCPREGNCLRLGTEE